MSELSYESTQHVVDLDGLNTAYHEAGTGEPLILLHGSGPGVTAWGNFRFNIPVFAEEYRVIAPDMAGFGLSELGEINELYSVMAANRVIRLMDHLGIEQAAFVGNSMGAAVASELAARYPERISKLVMMGAGGLSQATFQPGPSEGFKRLFEFLDDPTRERMIAWLHTMLFDSSQITDELVEMRMNNALAPGAIERTKRIFAGMFSPELLANHTPLWTKPESIKTPTLMLWGRDDRTVPYDMAHFANRMLPDVELHTFSRCGHWIQIERKRDFERVVLEFVGRHD